MRLDELEVRASAVTVPGKVGATSTQRVRLVGSSGAVTRKSQPPKRKAASPSRAPTVRRQVQPRDLEPAPAGMSSVVTICISIPPASLDAIDEAARAAGMTRSSYFRRSALAFVATKAKPP